MRPGRRPRPAAVFTTFVLSLAGLVALAPAGASAQATGCPSVGTDFGGAGPFDVTVEQASEHTYFSPANLGSQGCDRHPVILWGNGTFTTPNVYGGLLEHLASHGFIVAAANTSNAGSGEEMLAGLDNLTAFDADSGSRYHDRVATDLVATTGHSQGGAGTVRAAMDPRVTTMMPIEGSTTPTGVTGTALYLAGENDPLRGGMQDAYAASSDIGAAYAELAGAGHLEPLGNGGGFRPALTAWARWQLMGDGTAGAQFLGADCGLCTSSAWSDYEANERLDDEDPGDPGDPGDPDDCVTASNSEHLAAGRASRSFLVYRAVGSNDSLGILSTSTTSVEETSPGYWERVGSC